MSSPRPVVVDYLDIPIVVYSRHDETCSAKNCDRVAHLGFDSSAGEFGPEWLCPRCIGEALAAL